MAALDPLGSEWHSATTPGGGKPSIECNAITVRRTERSAVEGECGQAARGTHRDEERTG